MNNLPGELQDAEKN